MTRSSTSPIARRPRPCARQLLAAATLAAAPVLAQAVDWQGPGSDWLDPTNWSPAVLPNAGTLANFPATPLSPTVNLDGQASALGLTIDTSPGYTFSGTGTLSLGAAGITLTGTNPLVFSPSINVATAQTWSLPASSTLSLTHAIQGIKPVTVDGGGMLDLQFGENNFAGNFVVANGILTSTNFSDGASRAFRSNRITLGPTASLAAQGATFGSFDTGELAGSGTFDAGAGGLFIHALADATFSGVLKIGSSSQGLTVRGIGAQAFTGDTSAAKGPPAVTEGATVILAGDAAFLDAVANSYFARGGHMILDDSAVNLPNRLNPTGNLDGRGSTDNTVLLIGNTNGSSQTFNNLILNNGTLKLKIQHAAGSSAPTTFTFNGLNRAGTQATVDFSATGGVLGSAVNAPRVMFVGTGAGTNAVQLLNGVIATGTNATATAGFATVNNASDFASYDPTLGVVPVTTTPFPAASDPTANALLTTSATANNAGGAFALNTLKIQLATPGQSLDVTSPGGLATSGIMLVGPNSFTISSSAGGPVTSQSQNTRYLYVSDPAATLTISANVAPAGDLGPITKAGPGVLALTGINTFALSNGTAAVNINILDGVLRASATSLPDLKTVLRFRGGVFELVGGGLINRQVGNSNVGTNGGSVNWFGGNSNDQGSGGFSAFGGSAVVNLDNPLLPDTYAWGSSPSFLSAGYSLVFGSKSADSVVEWQDNISLSGQSNTANFDRFYNLREIRVVDNPASTGDRAVFSGALTSNDITLGGQNADWIKTGDGTLELTNANNNYFGNTIVANGTLRVTGNITNSPNYLLRGGQMVVSGSIRTGANLSLTGGSATFSSARVSLGAVDASAGTLALSASPTHNAKVLTVRSLATSGNGKVDLANNGMVIDYDDGTPNQLAAVRAALRNGFNNDGWNGANGILSTSAAANHSFRIGYTAVTGSAVPAGIFPGAPVTIDGAAVILKYTLGGDANLNGTVDFNDLVALAQNYNREDGNAVWAEGDYNYDGNVNFEDLVNLAQNYNTSIPASPIPGAPASFQADLAAAFAAVPEPGAITLVAAGALALSTRRRRRPV